MLQTLSTLEDVQRLYQWFGEMRQNQPVWLDRSSGCWHVFRYADVREVITNYTNFSTEDLQKRFASFRSSDGNTTMRQGRNLLTIDPPQHRQYRNLVSPNFTPHALSRLTERITTVTQELLDGVRFNGALDVVADIAYPLPTIVIAEMLGVPTSDRPLFRRWADVFFSQQLNDADFTGLNQEQQSNPAMQRIVDASDEMFDYFKGMLEERQRAPRNDMMSELLAAEVDGEHLSIEDTISFCILLLLAGHVTTTNLLSQAIRCFDEHPEAREYVRAHPEAMPGAIEEILRYASPVWRITRHVKTDVVLSGVTIPAGSLVFAWLAAANRDEEQFLEPERFDIARTPNRHIAFGHGVHFCIGAPLSRMEASIALPMILEQLPQLRIVREKPLELFKGPTLFGFEHLPATFTPTRRAEEPAVSGTM